MVLHQVASFNLKESLNTKRPQNSSLFIPTLLKADYCAKEILTCKPPRVLVIGNALLIFGMFLFCSK